MRDSGRADYEDYKKIKRGGERHGLSVKGIKTTLVLSWKKHGIRSQLCQLVSNSDYARFY